MVPTAPIFLRMVLPAALLLGACTEGSPDGGGEASPAVAVTTEKGLTDLLARAGTAPLEGSECRGTRLTTSGTRFEYHSAYSCAGCRKSALSFYRGSFARALEAQGWQRTPIALPQRFEFRKGKQHLVVEVGSDAQAAVDGQLRTFITHGLR